MISEVDTILKILFRPVWFCATSTMWAFELTLFLALLFEAPSSSIETSGEQPRCFGIEQRKTSVLFLAWKASSLDAFTVVPSPKVHLICFVGPPNASKTRFFSFSTFGASLASKAWTAQTLHPPSTAFAVSSHAWISPFGTTLATSSVISAQPRSYCATKVAT